MKFTYRRPLISKFPLIVKQENYEEETILNYSKTASLFAIHVILFALYDSFFTWHVILLAFYVILFALFVKVLPITVIQ